MGNGYRVDDALIKSSYISQRIQQQKSKFYIFLQWHMLRKKLLTCVTSYAKVLMKKKVFNNPLVWFYSITV